MPRKRIPLWRLLGDALMAYIAVAVIVFLVAQ